MTEQERAAALADIEALVALVEGDCEGPGMANHHDKDSVGWRGDGMPLPMTFGHIRRAALSALSALSASARPAPADLREAIIKATHNASRGWIGEGDLERIADAILSLLPQTQATSDADKLRSAINYATDKYDGDAIEWLRAWNYGDLAAMAELDRAVGKEG